MNDTRGRHMLSCLPCHPVRLSAVHSWAGPNQRESDRSAENMRNACFQFQQRRESFLQFQQRRGCARSGFIHGRDSTVPEPGEERGEKKRSRLGRLPTSHRPAAAAGDKSGACARHPVKPACTTCKVGAISRRHGLSRQEKPRGDARL